jgi:raffinose/stachyose/melibiose transport system permease protein
MAGREITLKRVKHYWQLYAFVLPSAVLVAIFAYYPAVSAMYHAFFRWNGEDISLFVGDDNFQQVLGNYWLWLAVLFAFVGILYTSTKKSSKADFFRMLGSVFILIISSGTMAAKGLAFNSEIIIKGAQENVLLLNMADAGATLGLNILVWGIVLMCLHFLISEENDQKWFYMLFPVAFLASAFLQAFGFTSVFSWNIVLLLAGCLLWFVPAAEKLASIENVRTFHGFISLAVCTWALAKFSGGDPVLWGGFSVIAILICFNIVKMLPSILTAVIIHRLKNDTANYWYRVLFVIPMIIPGMVALLLWKFFFNPNEGLFNKILINSGIMNLLCWLDSLMGWNGAVFKEGVMPVWLGNPDLVLPALIIWGFPWVGVVGVLIYLAGLQAIPETVYEAADLDGANAIQIFLKIELPLILTQIRINMVLMIIGTLKTYAFILILFGDNGGPNGKLMVPGLFMFRTAFKDGMAGYACAIGLVIFFFILILTEINNRYVRVEK